VGVGWCHIRARNRSPYFTLGRRRSLGDRVFERLKRSRKNTGGEVLMVYG